MATEPPVCPPHGSPSQRPGDPTQINEADLPKGHCRYILLIPEIKGQRCACVNFALNRSMPSATCDCGHLACFHMKADETAVADKHEVELLRQRITVLEQQLDRETHGGFGSVVTRVSEFEEHLDKAKEDTRQEIKSLYRNITQVWRSIQQLEDRAMATTSVIRSHDERIKSAHARIGDLLDRQLELRDSDEVLEERLEVLESAVELDGPGPRGRPRRKSTSDSLLPRNLAMGGHSRRRSSATRDMLESRPHADLIEPASLPFRQPVKTEGPWTVHISFLPDASQPFPFEKDTTAYKRCLSRGLHQMVVVDNSTADAFTAAVSNAFGPLLQGRPWMPLQAKLCDAKQLQGLPMLRPLDAKLRDARYDVEFLQQHCAVCDAGGKIESLYIAMRADTLSWHFLRHSPIYLGGLEGCWRYDHVLDLSDPFDDGFPDDRNRPSAGDVTGLPLKRAASEMSRAPSFGSASVPTDGGGGGGGEGSRKMQRTACLPSLVDMPRRTEKV